MERKQVFLLTFPAFMWGYSRLSYRTGRLRKTKKDWAKVLVNVSRP